MQQLTPAIFKQLKSPLPTSHKGQNGILYVVAGSKQYHGSLWYVVEIASHFVDLIYIETDLNNYPLIRKLKTIHPAMIIVSPKQRKRYLAKSDCVVIGPGLSRGTTTAKLVKAILTSKWCPAKRVIDADALYYLQDQWLTPETVLTPHAGEYRALFNKQLPESASKTIKAIIVAKGHTTWICQNGKCQYNTVGNAGLTKGGSGDVLAGLIAALGCTNSMVLASQAGSLLNGLAANQLAHTKATYFSIRELIQQIPNTLYQWQPKKSS